MQGLGSGPNLVPHGGKAELPAPAGRGMVGSAWAVYWVGCMRINPPLCAFSSPG